MKRLDGRSGVVLDTMVFIYLFEDVAPYAEVCQSLVQRAAAGHYRGVISPVTAAELLVKPLAAKRHDLADQYRVALRNMHHLELAIISAETGYMAAALRAKYGLPLPDMLQVALAVQAEQPTLITNDRQMRRIREVEVVLLDDLVGGAKAGPRV